MKDTWYKRTPLKITWENLLSTPAERTALSAHHPRHTARIAPALSPLDRRRQGKRIDRLDGKENKGFERGGDNPSRQMRTL